MIGKIHLEMTKASDRAKCSEAEDRVDNNSLEEPRSAKECKDENWLSAVKVFKQLIQRYPQGRYARDAQGWLAHLYLLAGEQDLALAGYYKLLGNPTDRNARLEAKKSLQILGHDLDDETLDRVEKLIAGDVNAAMAYSYHRVYNHAVDLTYLECGYWGGEGEWEEEREKETQRVSHAHETGTHELERIARFSSAMIARYPGARVSGGFVLRVAETQMELQHFADARTLAKKALKLGLSGDLKAQALWIKGSSEHHEKGLSLCKEDIWTIDSGIPKFETNRRCSTPASLGR